MLFVGYPSLLPLFESMNILEISIFIYLGQTNTTYLAMGLEVSNQWNSVTNCVEVLNTQLHFSSNTVAWCKSHDIEQFQLFTYKGIHDYTHSFARASRCRTLLVEPPRA